MASHADRIPILKPEHVCAWRVMLSALTLGAGVYFTVSVVAEPIWILLTVWLAVLAAIGVSIMTVVHALWARHEIGASVYHLGFDVMAFLIGAAMLLSAWGAYPAFGLALAALSVQVVDIIMRHAAHGRSKAAAHVSPGVSVSETWRRAYQGDTEAVRELQRLYFDSDQPEHRLLSVLQHEIERRQGM